MVPLYNTDKLYYSAITEEPMLYINFIQAAYSMDKGTDEFLDGRGGGTNIFLQTYL
jgi:hypothetical protein